MHPDGDAREQASDVQLSELRKPNAVLLICMFICLLRGLLLHSQPLICMEKPHPVFPNRRPAASKRDGVARGFGLEVARLALHTRNGRRIYEGSKATTPCGTVEDDRKLLTANDGRGNLHVVHDGWNARPVFAGRYVADVDVDSLPRVGGA